MFPDRDKFNRLSEDNYYTQYEEVTLASTSPTSPPTITLRSKLDCDLQLQADRLTFLCIWYDSPDNPDLVWEHSRRLGIHHLMN